MYLKSSDKILITIIVVIVNIFLPMTAIHSLTDASDHTFPYKYKFNSDLNVDSADKKCFNCRKKRYIPEEQLQFNEDKVKEVHIEMIKQQILLKLSLKSEPNITLPISSLPQPIYQGQVTKEAKASWKLKQSKDDGFYGRTEQVVILAGADDDNEESNYLCMTKRLYPTGCFTFRFPKSINPMTITSVDLWAYKMFEEKDKVAQTFVISEVSRSKVPPYGTRKKTIGVEQLTHKHGWIRFEMDAWVLRNWLMKNDLHQTIEISCKSCDRDLDDSPVSLTFSQRPFFVVNNDPNLEIRKKRSLECSPHSRDCCKVPFTVSFEEIGWSNWIIEPQEYTAYYCRGSCDNPAAVPLAKYQHSSIRQRLLTMKDDLPKQLREELTPCCAPNKMTSLMIAYLEDNRIVQTKVLPNMIVESCGCL